MLKIAIAVSGGGKKLPPYKWKGDESGFKVCFKYEKLIAFQPKVLAISSGTRLG